MSSETRVGDIGTGVCYWHDSPQQYTTVFATGAGSVLTNNAVTCTVGSIGHASCGHPTVALTGSPNVFAEYMSIHRVGDVGQNGGPYTAVSGSPNVTANS